MTITEWLFNRENSKILKPSIENFFKNLYIEKLLLKSYFLKTKESGRRTLRALFKKLSRYTLLVAVEK